MSCETQDKLKELEKENTELSGQVSELHCKLRSREDELFKERTKMKKVIALLRQSLDSKEGEVMKLENDRKNFKKELKHLNSRLRAVSFVTSFFITYIYMFTCFYLALLIQICHLRNSLIFILTCSSISSWTHLLLWTEDLPLLLFPLAQHMDMAAHWLSR